MTLAWFRPTDPEIADPLDDTAALVPELRAHHAIDVFTGANAHDFVWKHFRSPYELAVFELDNTRAHTFIWPYLLQYGGVLLLRTLSLHNSRAEALEREQRLPDYISEFTFNHGRAPRLSRTAQVMPGNWPMLRVPLLASRVTVVSNRHLASALQDEHPSARLCVARTGVAHLETVSRTLDGPGAPVTFGVLFPDRIDGIRRALARANAEGASAALVAEASPADTLQRCDVVIALRWPSAGEPQTGALAGMAAGKPVVVLETEVTAEWPALDPQSWQPRGLSGGPPMVISIDPRDEEHSLMLAIRRLSTDAALRAELGEAARAWWSAHATVRHATEDWEGILSEAAAREPPGRVADWPSHLRADGTEHARAILETFGATVDIIQVAE